MRSSSLFIGLAILVGSAFGARAQTTNTPQVGSTGGAAFDDRCNGTDLMIGYNISENKALSSLQAVCQARTMARWLEHRMVSALGANKLRARPVSLREQRALVVHPAKQSSV